MADKLVEKRRFVWSITNYSRENVNKYNSEDYIDYAPVEITLGSNRTEWIFRFYPKNRKDYCGFFIRKIKNDRNDFSISLELVLRNIHFGPFKFLCSEIKPTLGWSTLSYNATIIEEKGFNTLEIGIDLELSQHCSSAESQSIGCDSVTPTDLIISLFNSNDFHDITLVCSDGEKIPAHRCILAVRSSVFNTMLAADMLEKQSNSIAIDDIDSETMLEVLRFMYTNKAENLDKIASKIIHAAEKYDLQKLKSLCVPSMMSQITNDNVFELVSLADRYNVPDMMRKCMAFINRNYWTLKNSHHWNEMSSDLILKYVQYLQEVVCEINLPAASL